MRLAATSWAVVAFTMITAVCIAALLFLRPSAVNWVVRALYLGPLLGLGAAGLELMWLNVGAPVPSTLERMLRVIGRRRPEPHVDVPDPRDG